jgi:hypothetical protein
VSNLHLVGAEPYLARRWVSESPNMTDRDIRPCSLEPYPPEQTVVKGKMIVKGHF